MTRLTTLEALEAIYGPTNAASTVKELDHLNAPYRAYIEASPFCALATVGPEGLDCSPRGDAGGVVRIADDRTLMMPDRRGNNRCDSLRNIVRDPRVALMFMIPGSNTTLRVNGRAVIETDPALLDSFMMEGKPPRSVVVVTVDAVYFQCARALMRGQVWNPETFVDPASLPTAGQMLAAASAGAVGGEAYDREWPERAKASMW
ncbi:pyridoxamine 5'-phosphate oxidase family protein [Phenylobacterium aquaticum]|uniref:pyridoxamine 5'-phosphate oxidase family protein n=1 Tax=Phenylobacterium aquaticum TaxID=1763816 RepID=UPI001F5CAF8C|nr:pyridoxamine 5'-phosphate oxidase family protein [Phenylobacterium aquaticum]MCI3134181.1 pyridoxamine 5'-phosphate oxidase family protein [Phenylobacterium aquaticum]